MHANATLQNLLWEKNPTGIQDFMYPLTEAELSTLYEGMWQSAQATAEAEWENADVECDRHHCECCGN